MKVESGYDLYLRLKQLDLLRDKPEFWWPNPYTFEVLIGAILTQNTQWTRVELSLENLRKNNLLTLETMADSDLELLVECIHPSGFYNAKSQNIKLLATHIIEDFGDFKMFQSEVSREWLLSQKGIGPESADSILCYGCQHEVMVVDKYTQQLLNALGMEFDDYDEIQQWCTEQFYSEALHKDFAHFHGMIVEYMKRYKKGKVINIEPIVLVQLT